VLVSNCEGTVSVRAIDKVLLEAGGVRGMRSNYFQPHYWTTWTPILPPPPHHTFSATTPTTPTTPTRYNIVLGVVGVVVEKVRWLVLHF